MRTSRSLDPPRSDIGVLYPAALLVGTNGSEVMGRPARAWYMMVLKVSRPGTQYPGVQVDTVNPPMSLTALMCLIPSPTYMALRACISGRCLRKPRTQGVTTCTCLHGRLLALPRQASSRRRDAHLRLPSCRYRSELHPRRLGGGALR
jgi:hypothetical protein